MKWLWDIYIWLVNRPAYLLMTASAAAMQSQRPERFGRSWIGVMLLSLGWGLAACGVWSLAHLALGSGGHGAIFPIPALATGVMFCLWSYRQAMIATAEALVPTGTCGTSSSSRSLVLAMLLVSVVGIYSAFTGGEWAREFDLPLPAYLQGLRPYWRHFRLLLLAPLWGGWAMIIAPKFRRLSPTADAATAAFARGCGPFVAVLCMLLPLAATLFYFQYLYWWWQVIIPGLTIVSVPAAAWLTSRRHGLDRSTLLATNLLTQLVFLLTYIAGLNWGGKAYY